MEGPVPVIRRVLWSRLSRTPTSSAPCVSSSPRPCWLLNLATTSSSLPNMVLMGIRSRSCLLVMIPLHNPEMVSSSSVGSICCFSALRSCDRSAQEELTSNSRRVWSVFVLALLEVGQHFRVGRSLILAIFIFSPCMVMSIDRVNIDPLVPNNSDWFATLFAHLPAEAGPMMTHP